MQHLSCYTGGSWCRHNCRPPGSKRCNRGLCRWWRFSRWRPRSGWGARTGGRPKQCVWSHNRQPYTAWPNCRYRQPACAQGKLSVICLVTPLPYLHSPISQSSFPPNVVTIHGSVVWLLQMQLSTLTATLDIRQTNQCSVCTDWNLDLLHYCGAQENMQPPVSTGLAFAIKAGWGSHMSR